MNSAVEILYVANMRLPSEKAHSVHVMEMCAALAAAGARVTLVVPDRKTNVAVDPFEYYVLGDSRNVSIDSRRFGSIDRWSIKGRVIYVARF